jgi:AAA domain, putative AbiEii toxin, Type IV TA system
MKLTFKSTYQSITSFPETSLPKFTLVTGANGAGKTHLLKAIETGGVVTDVVPSPRTGLPPNEEIRYFDWNSLVPTEIGGVASEALQSEQTNFIYSMRSILGQAHVLEPIRAVLRSRRLPSEFVSNPTEILNYDNNKLTQLFQNFGGAAAISDLETAVTASERIVKQNVDAAAYPRLRAVAEASGKPIIALTEKDLIAHPAPNWGSTNLFQQSFARLFVAYRDFSLRNKFNRYLRAEEGADVDALTDEQFVQKYGPPPWDFVNQLLGEAGVSFTIDLPVLTHNVAYQPRLISRISGAHIDFQNLSSGEKILMAFVFSVYYASERRQITSYPKVLLFDEIDAPLHPSMSKNIIDTIVSTLWGNLRLMLLRRRIRLQPSRLRRRMLFM